MQGQQYMHAELVIVNEKITSGYEYNVQPYSTLTR